LCRTNRRVNIIALISYRAALFQKLNVKADLNEYLSIKAESSAAKNWWEHYLNEKCGQAGNGVFLSSCDDLWLHAIMKIAERFKAKPLFIVTCDNKAKIYIDKESYTKIEPYLPIGISFSVSAGICDKSIIDTAVDELDWQLNIMLDKKRIALEDEWLEYDK
jgi:hypothetical protein